MQKLKIKDPIYNCDITLISGCKQDEFYRYIEKKYNYTFSDKSFSIGEHLEVIKPKTWIKHYLWIQDIKFTIKDYGVINHEVFHCAKGCFDEIGLEIIEATEEAFAYYQEYIFEEVLKVLARAKEIIGKVNDE
jgi:hypothetical protein